MIRIPARLQLPYRKSIVHHFRFGVLLCFALLAWGQICFGHSDPSVELTPEESAWLASHKTITLGSTPAFEPGIVQKNGQVSGIFVDLVDEINRRLGSDIRIELDQWPRILEKAELKEVDGIVALSSENADLRGLLKTQSHFSIYPAIYGWSGTQFTGPADLVGKRVAYAKDHQIAEAAIALSRDSIEVLLVDSPLEALRLVYEEKADFMVGQTESNYLVRKYGLAGLKPVHIFRGKETKSVIGVRSDWPELVSILNKALASISEEELINMYVRWTHVEFPEQGIILTPEERAWLEANPAITLGYTDSFEPALIRNNDGTYSGIIVDFIDEINRRLGSDIRIKIGPWPEIQDQAEQNEIDGLACIVPELADDRGLLKTQSHFAVYPTVFGRTGSSFTRPEDMEGKSIAYTEGHRLAEIVLEPFKETSEIIPANSALEALRLVYEEKVDFMVGQTDNNYLLRKFTLAGVVPVHVYRDRAIECVTGISSNKPELLSILNKTLSSFSDEDFVRIYSRWTQLNVLEQEIVLTPEEQAWLEENPIITLGYTEGFDPALIRNEDGSFSGIMVDFVEEINRCLGSDIRIEVDQWADIVDKAEKHLVDGLVTAAPQLADARGLLKTQGHFTIYSAVYGRSETPFRGPSDLAGKKIAHLKAHRMAEMVLEPYMDTIEVVHTDSALEALELVYRGEVDFMVGQTDNNYLLAKYGLSSVAPLYIFRDQGVQCVTAIRSDRPELVSILNKVLSTFSEKDFSRIYSRWSNVELPEAQVALTPDEQAWLDQNYTVRVNCSEYPPFFSFADGEVTGIAIDYLNSISKRTGITFQFANEPTKFADQFSGIIDHTGPDIISAIMPTPSREEHVLFTEPYIYSPRFIFTRDDAPFIYSLNNVVDRKVSVIEASQIHHYLTENYPEIELQPFANKEAALGAVSSGGAFAYIGNILATSAAINQFGFHNIKAACPSGLPDHPQAIGVRDDWPELRSILDKALDAMPPDEKAAILNRWSTVKVDYDVQLDDILRWALVVWIGVMCFVGLFIIWNRKLAKEVSRRKLAEQLAKEARDSAEAASLAKSSFLAEMSHDLRTPLNAILGFSRNLARAEELSAESRKEASIIKSSGDHLLQMIDEILSLSRIEAGRIDLQMKPFGLTRFLNETVRMVSMREEAQKLDLEAEFDSTLPPFVIGDEGKLRQILVNLMDNAVKFTAEGRVLLRARAIPVEGDSTRVLLELSVEDTGAGIPSEQQDAIFDSFVRVNDPSVRASGTGLGLAICQSLAQAMGGSITLLSQLGTGSVFTVTLPVETATEAASGEKEMHSLRLKPGTTPARILVVDDNANNRDLLSSILKRAGFSVQEANDGVQAIEAFKTWEPNLICMDMRMPIIDGYAATKAIRALPEGLDVRIIAVTASVFEEKRRRILDAGCDELVFKPIRENHLLDIIARQLQLEYEEADGQEDFGPSTQTELTSEMLAELPEQLRTDLRQAALLLDTAAMPALIERIEQVAPETAVALEQLVEDYRLGHVVVLLEEIS